MTPSDHSEVKLLSVVVCMYNEAPVIDAFLERLQPVLDGLHEDFEIICVNDGSSDQTLRLLMDARGIDRRIKIVSLSRNFGKEIAMTAGLDYAGGDAVLFIDADLQDPPEVIPQMVTAWKNGFDMVYGVRMTRHADSWLKRWTAKQFYRIFNSMGEISIPANGGDFRLFSRQVADALRHSKEKRRFMKGLFAWVGFKQTSIEYEREVRAAGRTKWSYWRLVNLAIEGITAYTSVPLRIWSYLGAMTFVMSMLMIAYMIANYFFIGGNLPGFYVTIVSILFFGGIQMITLGILGEYVSRIYDEVKDRPLYIAREVIGFDEVGLESGPARVEAAGLHDHTLD